MMSDPGIGNKPGLAAKWPGCDWEPATHVHTAPSPPGRLEALMSYARGEPLPREAFPEALHVFDRRRFERLADLSAAGGFYLVKGRLAQILARCDLGQGGLIPIPIYQEDKLTPVIGEFFIWVFSDQKQTFLPEQSRGVRPDGIGLNIVRDRWKVRPDVEDDDIALSAEAVSGPPNVWCDRKLAWSLFFSDALVGAMRAAGIKIDLSLTRCRLV
jgi:hypothetical protein